MNRKMDRKKVVFWCYLGAGTLILAVFFACIGFSMKVKAGPEKEKILSVVSVKEGDTIWDIAADFYTEEYKDLNAFVKTIKKCNGVSDHIRIGQNLIIPHYKDSLLMDGRNVS